MTLKEQIRADFMSAMKAKDPEKKSFLGVILGEIQNMESRPDFKGDESVLSIVRKMEKSLNETAKGDGPQAEQSKVEIQYLQPYLPKLMAREQVVVIVTGLVESGASNIGAVMKEFSTTYKGQADNNMVKDVAQELLKV